MGKLNRICFSSGGYGIINYIDKNTYCAIALMPSINKLLSAWIWVSLLICHNIYSQANSSNSARQHLSATKVAEAPVIDGKLEEKLWTMLSPATEFTQNSPTPNVPSAFRTEVRVAYDDKFIYVGAIMYDPNPGSILRQFGTRDQWGSINADRFAVAIDGMFSKQNAFMFGVTAAGVEADAQLSSNSDDDFGWDGAWNSAVTIHEEGWSAELRIPYSMLRFAPSENQVWGINFFRSVRSVREQSYWSPIDPNINGQIQQYGVLSGITGIKPPVRLQFLPFAVGYLKKEGKRSDWSPQFSGGMDLKYGINEAFTLDMSLIPDFSDVLSDDQQFNIGPFELFFDERRPFFTEGVELFNRAGIFYSRRVGSAPQRYSEVSSILGPGETIVNNPGKTNLLNATKLSGRTSKGLGLGFFNAITGETQATIRNQNGEERQFVTNPLTNYNVLVIDKLGRNNSYISFINTNVYRAGEEFQKANVSAIEFKQTDKTNTYAIAGSGAGSLLFLPKNASQQMDNGFKTNVSIGKISGRWQWYVQQEIISDRYDHNDLGYLQLNNQLSHEAQLDYKRYKPFGIFNNMGLYLWTRHEALYKPGNFMSFLMNVGGWSTTKKFMSSGFDIVVAPIDQFDFYDTRVENRSFRKPQSFEVSGWFSSDYRKPVALDGNFGFNRWFQGFDRTSINGRLTPIFRVNDRFNFSLTSSVALSFNDYGFATFDGNGDVTFGQRYRQDITSTINAQYLFNKYISVSLRVRHYWGLVEYKQYYTLAQNSELLSNPNNFNRNTNFNAFNVDLFFRWRFAPGSEFNFVWKNAVLSSGRFLERDYGRNLQDVLNDNSQNNTLSIKALYFVDYNALKNLKLGQRRS